MKANELRIGNHIINDGCVCEILHLFGGTYNYCRLKTLQGGDIVALYDLIKPIPLTHELLEKCGFAKAGSNYEKDWLLLHTHLERQTFDFLLYESSSRKLKATPILYLHQLQNLVFALTGEELEINLEEK